MITKKTHLENHIFSMKNLKDILKELDAVHAELCELKASLMKSIKRYNELNYKIIRLRKSIRKEIKEQENGKTNC